MKKTALTLALTSTLLFSVVGVFFIGFAEANPIYPIRPPNGIVPPKISILSPQNHTTYSIGDLNITLHVTKAVISSPTTFRSFGVSLFLDGVLLDSISELIPKSELDISTVLYNQLIGKHKLEAKASYVFAVQFGGVFSSDSTSTVYFAIEITPSLLNPSPPPEPAPTTIPNEEIDVQNTSQYLVIGGMFAFTVIAVCVGLGLVFYFIKRK